MGAHGDPGAPVEGGDLAENEDGLDHPASDEISVANMTLFSAADELERRLYPVGRNPALLYLATLSAKGARAMRFALERIAHEVSDGALSLEAVPWERLRYHHVAAIRTRLRERYAPATVNLALAALKGTLKQAWLLGQIDPDDYQRAIQVKPVRAKRLPRGRALNEGEFRALVNVCKEDDSAAGAPAGARDGAMLGALYVAGLRRSELVALELEHWDATRSELIVRGGKGDKDRKVFLEVGAARALRAWLEWRGPEPGALFCPINKGGRITIRRMSEQAVLHICKKRGAQAGLRRFSPHDLRRSCTSDLLDAGEDLVTVQEVMGHSSPTTTARYDRRGEQKLRRAANRLHWPW